MLIKISSTAEELERIVTIIQNPTQYKIPGCTISPDSEPRLVDEQSKEKDLLT